MPNSKVIISETLKDSEMHRVLELALEAGRVLLSNGAEIFRVEETIDHICRHFEVEEMDAFVLSNGIFLTAHDSGKEIFAKVKHVPLAGTNLEIVTEVNNLSREISAGHVSVDEAFARLREIEQLPPKKNIELELGAGIGSGVFCYLMGGNIYESLFTVLIGFLLYAIILFAGRRQVSKIIINLVGGAFITVMGLIVSNISFPFEVALDNMIIGCILPMIPGAAVYYTAYNFVMNDLSLAVDSGIHALKTAFAIVLGIVFIVSIPRQWFSMEYWKSRAAKKRVVS